MDDPKRNCADALPPLESRVIIRTGPCEVRAPKVEAAYTKDENIGERREPAQLRDIPRRSPPKQRYQIEWSLWKELDAKEELLARISQEMARKDAAHANALAAKDKEIERHAKEYNNMAKKERSMVEELKNGCDETVKRLTARHSASLLRQESEIEAKIRQVMETLNPKIMAMRNQRDERAVALRAKEEEIALTRKNFEATLLAKEEEIISNRKNFEAALQTKESEIVKKDHNFEAALRKKDERIMEMSCQIDNLFKEDIKKAKVRHDEDAQRTKVIDNLQITIEGVREEAALYLVSYQELLNEKISLAGFSESSRRKLDLQRDVISRACKELKEMINDEVDKDKAIKFQAYHVHFLVLQQELQAKENEVRRLGHANADLRCQILQRHEYIIPLRPLHDTTKPETGGSSLNFVIVQESETQASFNKRSSLQFATGPLDESEDFVVIQDATANEKPYVKAAGSKGNSGSGDRTSPSQAIERVSAGKSLESTMIADRDIDDHCFTWI